MQNLQKIIEENKANNITTVIFGSRFYFVDENNNYVDGVVQGKKTSGGKI